MNKTAFRVAGVTEKDFKDWCQETGRAAYRPETKAEFFARIKDGRLVKDASGHLVRKYKRS